MDNKCEIKLAALKDIKEPLENEPSFKKVFECNWPLPGYQQEPKEKIVRTKITTLTIDRTNAKFNGQELALRVGINQTG